MPHRTDTQPGTWAPGEVIAIQDVWRGRLWTARAVIVVDDTPDLLVAWSPKGSSRKVPATPPTRVDAANRGERLASSLALGDWILEDKPWDVSNLWLLREGDWHATWVSFLESGEQWGWYVNFQEPFRRTPHGIQTMDLALDIIVEPDRSGWRWKDEDEFELFRARGLDRRGRRPPRPRRRGLRDRANRPGCAPVQRRLAQMAS